MKYAFFQGCNIPARIEQYADATQAVFSVFGVELMELREFNCCGYPVRNVDEKSYILPSARNLAVAEKEGLDIAVICNCCFASLMKAKNVLENDNQLKEEINLILAKEGLSYNGKSSVKHYLTILYSDIGVNTITSKLKYKVKNRRNKRCVAKFTIQLPEGQSGFLQFVDTLDVRQFVFLNNIAALFINYTLIG